MNRITASFEKQISNERSNEITFLLKVENIGDIAVNILSITPRIPEDVEILEVKDLSSHENVLRHAEIAADMTGLLSGMAIAHSKTFRERLISVSKEMVGEIMSVNGIARAYYLLFSGSIQKDIDMMAKKVSAIELSIVNIEDARIAKKNFLDDFDDDPRILRMFNAKMEQLELLENNMSESDAHYIASIESGSQFLKTYVLKFPRDRFNRRKFGLSIDLKTGKFEESQVSIISLTSDVEISPNSFFLSIVSLCSSLLGVVIYYSMRPEFNQGQLSFIANNIESITSKFVLGGILSIISFNIYEFLDIGKNIKIGIGWRSAMLIGVISGAFSDRIINSISILIGI